MVNLADLVNAMAATLSAIPEVVAALAPTDPIAAYVDFNPTSNSVDTALYEMQPGQVLVVWIETRLQTREMSKWVHTVEICLRSLSGSSNLDLINLILAGVPVPGDGMVWRNCPIMPGLLPTEISAISRRTDTEGTDYGVILTETAETGDWPYP